MKPFDDFDGLALFARIADAGGLAAAERATSIPKATLSRRLAALEARLNVRLVRRSKKGVVLTEAGERLYQRARAALTLAEEGLAEVQGDKAALTGRLRLSLPPDLASAILAPALIRFQIAHPGVELELMLADRNVSLVEEGYDLAIRMGPLADSALMSRRLALLPRLLVASPELLATHPGVLHPRDLSGLPALAIRRDLQPWRFIAPGGQQATPEDVTPRVVFAANRQTLLIEALRSGLGIAVLPEFLVRDVLHRGEVVPLLPEWHVAPIEVTALWQKDRITSRLSHLVVDALAEALRQRRESV